MITQNMHNLNLKWITGDHVPRVVPQGANVRWSLDLMETLSHGQRFRILAVADDFTRECLGLVVDVSFTSLRVARELEYIIQVRHGPRMIVSHYASEFASIEMLNWHEEFGIVWCHNGPHNSMQRLCAESLNRRLSNECLKKHLFANLNEARQIVEKWRIDYNNHRTRA